ncbi:MAG TPA: HNH endonuclease signature motif containing protein, partial [Nitriliruptorales bacterium]
AVEQRVPVQVAGRSSTRSRSMSARTMWRLACAAGMVAAIHDAEGRLTAMSGRTSRVPPRLMRALRTRDRRCRYPGCGATRWVEAHHIHEVSKGGKTRLNNLVLLCVRHHHVVHDQGVTILHDGRGRMRFVLADGTRLDPSPLLPGASAEAPPLAPADDRARDPGVLQPTAYQQRIDLAACVDILLQELDLLEYPTRITAAA